MNSLRLILLMAVAVFLAGPTTGCKTNLQPGVYGGNEVLYNADRTIVESMDVLDKFVKWEADNRPTLAAYPDVTKAADNVRANAKTWLSSAIALREAYATDPTSQNKDNLTASISVLRAALGEAAKYMAKPLN